MRHAHCEAYWSPLIEQTQSLLLLARDDLDSHTDAEEALALAEPHDFTSLLNKFIHQTRAAKSSWLEKLTYRLAQLQEAKQMCFEAGLVPSTTVAEVFERVVC